MKDKLTQEEKEILAGFEAGEWVSDPALETRKAYLEKTAGDTLKKNRRVNIRISERDMVEIKKRAIEEGLPYQTLISSILHKYVNGRLVDKSMNPF